MRRPVWPPTFPRRTSSPLSTPGRLRVLVAFSQDGKAVEERSGHSRPGVVSRTWRGRCGWPEAWRRPIVPPAFSSSVTAVRRFDPGGAGGRGRACRLRRRRRQPGHYRLLHRPLHRRRPRAFLEVSNVSERARTATVQLEVDGLQSGAVNSSWRRWRAGDCAARGRTGRRGDRPRGQAPDALPAMISPRWLSGGTWQVVEVTGRTNFSTEALVDAPRLPSCGG